MTDPRPPAVALSALSDDEVVKAAREAVAGEAEDMALEILASEILSGKRDGDPDVRAAILGARAAAALRTGPASDEPVVQAIAKLRSIANAARADAAELDRQANAPGGADPSVQRMAYAMGAKCDYYLDAARIVEEARTAPAEGVAVPAGWKLVPIEPTEEMAYGAAVAHYGKRRVDRCGGIGGITESVDDQDITFWVAFRKYWKGALKAAPPAADAGDSLVDVLLAGKPFVFDPATNFAHADDGGAPEHGIKYVPAQPAAPDDLVARFLELADEVPAYAGRFREAATALQRLQPERDRLQKQLAQVPQWRAGMKARAEAAEAKAARLEGAFQEHIVEREWPASSAPGMVDELSPREAWAVGATDALMFAEEDIRRALTPPAGAAQEMGGRNDG